MDVKRIAAFSDGAIGGNPAGVVIMDSLPSDVEMQATSAAVGYSETAFACPLGSGWKVRYFSPESEVPFCGHATIALGAELAVQNGDGVFNLTLNEAEISVEGESAGDHISAALQSPPTFSRAADSQLVANALSLFGYDESQLDPNIPIAFAHAGANHLVICLNSRETLAAMSYDLAAGRMLMNEAGLVTILLGYAESAKLFHTRNPFASGGVYEDPATGAATAALAGYLRDINWRHEGSIKVVQGEDMGCRSLLTADISAQMGSSIRVSGAARYIE